MESLHPILAQHPFFVELAPEHIELLVGCAQNVRFERDDYLCREGEAADRFFLLRHGRVAIEARVQQRPRVIKTLGPGDILGWSWLVPPYHWHFDARAQELSRVIALDGACLRKKCEADHELGYHFYKRFSQVIADRLHQVWLQVADVYANHG